jgi:hypothetical protein
VSTTLKQEMITFHANITEIMRHFWASVPADTAERIAKNNRMVHTPKSIQKALDEYEAHVTKTTHPPSKRVVGTFYK